MERIIAGLEAGKPARSMGLNKDEVELVKPLMLLTMKPVIYAANVADCDLAKGNAMSTSVLEYAKNEGSKAVLVSAQVRSLQLYTARL